LIGGKLEVLGSLLQNIGREPQFHSFTLVAFNIHTQKVIHRQDNVSRVDTRSLRAAIENSDGATINYRSLLDSRSESKFIARVLTDELGTGMPQPDVVVVAGPKASVKGKVPLGHLKELREPAFPIFYYKSSFGYRIIRPRDIGVAISHLRGSLRPARLHCDG
jgi:hypothetical protein